MLLLGRFGILEVYFPKISGAVAPEIAQALTKARDRSPVVFRPSQSWIACPEPWLQGRSAPASRSNPCTQNLARHAFLPFVASAKTACCRTQSSRTKQTCACAAFADAASLRMNSAGSAVAQQVSRLRSFKRMLEARSEAAPSPGVRRKNIVRTIQPSVLST